MYLSLFEIFFLTLILLFILYIFCLTKTAYILFFSILVFIVSFIYILYLELEFIGLVFIITYIGGIAVMFLFLVLVLNTKQESKQLKIADIINIIFLWIFIAVIVLCLSVILSFIYDPFLFDDFLFYKYLREIWFENIENHSSTGIFQ